MLSLQRLLNSLVAAALLVGPCDFPGWYSYHQLGASDVHAADRPQKMLQQGGKRSLHYKILERSQEVEVKCLHVAAGSREDV